MISAPDTPSDPRRGKTVEDELYLRRVGDRVRAARDRLAMTRRGLSEISGVSERYLADLEAGTGNASLIILRRIAAALRIDIEVMLSDQADRPSSVTTIIAELSKLSPREIQIAASAMQRAIAQPTGAKPRRIALIGLRGAGKNLDRSRHSIRS